jgi:predicted DsbA family dithiol-disulfide isomerase
LVHSDREACEHSLSLLLETADDVPWGLSVAKEHVERPEPSTDPAFRADEEYAELPMRAGDAVMYRGVNHRHGRIQPNPNRWSAHLFMHWVDAHGPYADHAFDRVAIERAMSQAR